VSNPNFQIFFLFIYSYVFRNKDKVARSVKIIPPDSKLFQVFPCKKTQKTSTMSQTTTQTFNKPGEVENMSSRVAPGMEISYVIRFSPEAKIDYSYDLMIVTEREKFVVPIRAVGCRAMLDFPDHLDFGLVPVKHTAEKPVMVRNIGEKTTKWHIKVPNGFNVSK
jgi:hydrocephalus-inducing protein